MQKLKGMLGVWKKLKISIASAIGFTDLPQ